MVDSQRARLYAAEDLVAGMLVHGGLVEAHGSTLVLPRERRFGDVRGAAAYVTRVLELPSVAAWPRASVPVRVRERRGLTKAHYEFATSPDGEGVIALPPHRPGGGGQSDWALRESVVLHELAHHLLGAPGHGPDYVAVLVDLWRIVFGDEAALHLHVACHEHGVRIASETGPAA